LDISNIGAFLRTARKTQGLTQGQVADQLGVSAQAVSKWERGENLPDVVFFPDLAKMYNCSVEAILGAGRGEGERQFEKLLERMQKQLDDVIESIFEDENSTDYEYALDEILPYTNPAQRRDIMIKMLERNESRNLDMIIGFLGNELKTELLMRLLAEQDYEAIEDNILAFARKHRDAIVAHFEAVQPEPEIIENFMPFFDKNQTERIRRIYNE